jgi:hypothetical protein
VLYCFAERHNLHARDDAVEQFVILLDSLKEIRGNFNPTLQLVVNEVFGHHLQPETFISNHPSKSIVQALLIFSSSAVLLTAWRHHSTAEFSPFQRLYPILLLSAAKLSSIHFLGRRVYAIRKTYAPDIT